MRRPRNRYFSSRCIRISPALPRPAARGGPAGLGWQQPEPTQPNPRPFRLQIEPDGRVRYLDHPEGADLGYTAHNLNLTWGTTPASCDLAVLQILAEVGESDLQTFVESENGQMTR